MAADGCSVELIREQGLEEAGREIKVPLRNHLDRCLPRFLEGCPANHPMLSPAHFGGPFENAASLALSMLCPYLIGTRRKAPPTAARECCDFFPQSIHPTRLCPSPACLSHRIPAG